MKTPRRVFIRAGSRSRLEALAIEVAVSAPRKWSSRGGMAYIPRSLVDAIRAELEAQNVDWWAIAIRVELELERANADQETEPE